MKKFDNINNLSMEEENEYQLILFYQNKKIPKKKKGGLTDLWEMWEFLDEKLGEDYYEED